MISLILKRHICKVAPLEYALHPYVLYGVKKDYLNADTITAVKRSYVEDMTWLCGTDVDPIPYWYMSQTVASRGKIDSSVIIAIANKYSIKCDLSDINKLKHTNNVSSTNISPYQVIDFLIHELEHDPSFPTSTLICNDCIRVQGGRLIYRLIEDTARPLLADNIDDAVSCFAEYGRTVEHWKDNMKTVTYVILTRKGKIMISNIDPIKSFLDKYGT